MITTHLVPEHVFSALAKGAGDSGVVRRLRAAQHSKHLMLLRVVADAADDTGPESPAVAAFQAAYKLLTIAQEADPGAVTLQLGLPHMGGWGHDCLIRLDHGEPPDFGYLACVAAAAATRVGVPFELDIPVRDGRVLLPGLGYFRVPDQYSWVHMRSDGERITADGPIDARCADLVPDDGTGVPGQHWRGTPLVRATADGHQWNVLLEIADPYLDRYSLPMSTALSGEMLKTWRHRIESAWQVLVRHHSWASGPIADGVSVIVPLTQRSDADLDSATTPAAFGAIATSWPPDPVIMAETLVHEFQHLKLCGLIDMVPLVESGGERVYAPWRQDPRPAGGLLQGVYAHLGVACFWNVQRHVETEPDDILRAQVTYERWRQAIGLATGTLLSSDCLTQTGERFVDIVRDQGRSLESGTIPPAARDIAEAVAADHWLTWQFRHTAIEAAEVASLAASYQRGEPLGHQTLPESRIEEDTRKFDSTIRSRLLNMRYLEPRRYRELCATDIPELSEADRLLVSGNAEAAVAAYRDEIIAAADPLPGVWVGLAIAIQHGQESLLRQVFATKLPLLFDIHTCLAGQGTWCDPLDLAAWIA